MMRLLTILTLIFAVTASWTADVGPPPYSICNRADAPPAIDGDLSDPVWQKSAGLGPFVRINPISMPTEATTAFVLWDDENLYVAFDCRESQMDKLKRDVRERDGDELWEDDCVEVFIAPHGPGQPYYHFVLTAAGLVLDERGSGQATLDKSYNAGAQVGVKRGEDRWTAEMGIPFADLGGGPKIGDEWHANFNREEKPKGEWSGWAITTGTFHRPKEFGTIRFTEDEPALAMEDLGELFHGRGPAFATVRSGLESVAQLDDRSVAEGEEAAAIRAFWPMLTPEDGSDRISLHYDILNEGAGRLTFQVRWRATERQLVRTAGFPYYVPPLREVALDVCGGAVRAREAARRLPELIVERPYLIATADHLVGLAERVGKWPEACWPYADPVTRRALYDATLALRAQQRRLMHRVLAYTEQRSSGLSYAIGIESPLKKVLRDEPFEGHISSRAYIQMAANEYEPTQIVIVPFGKRLEDVRVTWTDLIQRKRRRTVNSIASHFVDVKRVGYVRTRGKTSADVEYVGWWPDPLMPLEPFDVEPGQNQPLWVTVHVPPGQPAGTYVGELTIQPANSGPSRVRLEVEVWDFELPKETHLRTAFHLGEPLLAQWYGYEELPQEVRRQWYQFLLDRRMSPSTLYSGEPLPRMEDLGWCIERGLNTFNIGYVGQGKTTDEWLAWLKQYCAELREKDWLKYAYVYGFDEVRPDGYEAVKTEYGRIHEAVPDLKRGCTVVPNQELDPYMDIWVPLTAHLNEHRSRTQQKTGDEMWWYVCIGPQHPHANWFVDYPAIEPRILFWMTHKYDVTGFLYYYLNIWNSNMDPEGGAGSSPPIDDNPTWADDIRAGKRWPEIEWNAYTWDHANGDGHLIYPGPDGQPISSIRLECIRDGIEDYEMFQLLDDTIVELRRTARTDELRTLLAECVQLSAIRPHVVRDLTHFTHEPQELIAERGRVARQLMRVRRVLERERDS